MTAEAFTRAQIALAAWRNAPTKDLQTLKLMGLIFRNRVRAGWMGGDWLRVIAADPIYSAYLPEAPGEAAPEFPDLADPSFSRFLWEADKIYEGTAEDKITGGGLWWCELNKVNREWFLENICRRPEQHPRVAQSASITLFA
jgi:hypothetical protein